MTMLNTEDEHKSINKAFESPETKGKLISSNSKWFLLSITLVLVILIMLFMLNNAYKDANKAPEYRWVMLYPDGQWRIQFTPPDSPQKFFRTTIDSLLTDYLEYRYQRIPQTIRNDFGRATTFMSKPVHTDFMKPTGGNAVEVAGTLSTSRSPIKTEISVLFFDHQDIVDDAIFASGKKPVIRTAAYIKEVDKDQYGNEVSRPVRRIVNLSWTLLSLNELKSKEKKFFEVNPLGLEILSEKSRIDGAYTETK